MDRAAALSYIANRYSSLIAQSGLAPLDDAPDFQDAINQALRGVGVAETDLATANVDDALYNVTMRAYLDYFTLDRIQIELAPKLYDLQLASGLRMTLSQAYAHVKAFRDEAKNRAKAFGLIVDVPAFGSGFINLDYLEPADNG